MRGYILYDNEGYQRNKAFSELLIAYGEKRGIHLKTVLREDLIPSMKNSSLVIATKNGGELQGDFIINRCIDPLFAEFLMRQGIKLFNSAEVCRICNDKRLTHMYFAQYPHIPMADSVFLNHYNEDYTPDTFPQILKAPAGHGGEQVFWINNEKELKDHFISDRLLQAPVKNIGRDLRVYVMAGKILCAMLRRSDRDFRSNFSLGGSAEVYTLSNEEKELISKVIRALPQGAFWIGIDFIFDGNRMLLNEIEDIVGARMLYKHTSIPVHELLVDGIINEMNKGVINGN